MAVEKTPSEWEEILGIRVKDPDGWRASDAPSWDTPITRSEFEQRAMSSTCQIFRGGALDKCRPEDGYHSTPHKGCILR